MTLEEKIEQIKEIAEETIILRNPDYAGALVGMAAGEDRVVYDYGKMIKYLMKKDGMTPEEAADFIMYNTLRSLPYMGDKVPIIMMPMEC